MSEKDKTAPTEPVTPMVHGAVFYTDGGARPTNPGYAGYGFHGYTYSQVTPKKGTGLPQWALTQDGYIKKEGKEQEALVPISPLHYVDGFGTIPGVVSNNVAEIAAATWALEYVKLNPVPIVKIFTDSKGTVEAVNNWLDVWAARGWVKSDGRPVANQDQLKALNALLKDVRSTGTQVQFHWIRSHNGHIGNEASDHLATMGVIRSMSEQGRSDHHSLDTVKADGYWTNKVERHPLLRHRALYFLTDIRTIQAGEYYMGDRSIDEADEGKRSADVCYAYVLLDKEDPALELVRNHTATLAQDDVHMCYAVLPKIYDKKVHPNLLKHGAGCLYRPNPKLLHLNYVDKDPVVRHFHPPILSWRAVEELNELKGLYKAWQVKDPLLSVLEVTELFYQPGKKDTLSLKPEFGSGTVKLDITVTHAPTGQTGIAQMQLGHDFPDRNLFKHLETLHPKVYVLCWGTPGHLRYASLTVCDGGASVQAGAYTNHVWGKPAA